MSRPDGEVVAPLPGAKHDGDHDVVVVDVTDSLGRTRVSCLAGVVAVVTWDQDGEVDGMSSADADHVARVLHDAGQLDAYRERCEVAAWRRFDLDDETTWPAAGERVLVWSDQHMFLAHFDRIIGAWFSTYSHHGLTRRSDVRWRPLPAGPVLP